MHKHIHTHIYTHTYTHTLIQAHSHTHIHTYTHTHKHTHTQTHTHAHTHTHRHTRARACTHRFDDPFMQHIAVENLLLYSACYCYNECYYLLPNLAKFSRVLTFVIYTFQLFLISKFCKAIIIIIAACAMATPCRD